MGLKAMTSLVRWCALLGAGVTALAIGSAGANGPVPRAVGTGDLIVRFTEGSVADKLVERALPAADPVPLVAPLAERLGRSLDADLLALGLTSGRELVLAIDRQRLAARMLARLRADSAVRSAEVPPGQAQRLPASTLAFKVQLAGNGSAAQALGSRLGAAGPLRIAQAQGTDLTLEYDVAAWAEQLVQRLQREPEVRYAQLNRVLRPQAPR
jgi:hypothetical protein